MAGRKINAMYKAYGRCVYKCKDCHHFTGKKCLAYGESANWNGNWMACKLFNEPFEGATPMTGRNKELDTQLDGQIGMEELL